MLARLRRTAPSVTLLALALLTAAASSAVRVIAQDQTLNPYDSVPSMTIPTESGEVVLGPGQVDESFVLLAYSPVDPWSDTIWESSVAQLLESSPDDVNYVFLSYGESPAEREAHIAGIQGRLETALAAMSGDDRAHWEAHIHFATENPMTAGGVLADLLADWGTTYPLVTAAWAEGGSPQTIEPDAVADTGWAPSLASTGAISGTLAYYGLACGDVEPEQPQGAAIALVERGECNFTEKVANAEAHGAKAVVIFTNDSEKIPMGGSCGPCPSIPVVMIDRQPGLELRTLVRDDVPVRVTLAPQLVGAQALAVDQKGRLRELGTTIPFPWDASIDPMWLVALEAQYWRYEYELELRLAAEEADGDVVVVEAFDAVEAADPGWAGVKSTVDVELPEDVHGFDTLELDLTLACPNNRKSACPPWDYLVHLYLCDADNPDRCDTELGRWITPYGSGGRWVTDVSPLLGLLADGGTRRLAFYTQQPYTVDLDLRFSRQGDGPTPRRAVELLRGGHFASGYNDRYHPMQFDVPEWASRVEVVAAITGHGWGRDTENCAEFCNHTHHIAVNGGDEHVKSHPVAGTAIGCALQVSDGVVPNQGGTWVYGRAGWCPGLEVTPWVIDITDEVVRGEINELTYKGLFNGEDYVAVPNPDANDQGFDAEINMRSYIVYYADPADEVTNVRQPWPRIPTTLYLPAVANRFAR